MQFPKDPIQLFEFISSREFEPGDFGKYKSQIPKKFRILFIDKMKECSKKDLIGANLGDQIRILQKIPNVKFEEGVKVGKEYSLTEVPYEISLDTLVVVTQKYTRYPLFVEKCIASFHGFVDIDTIISLVYSAFWVLPNQRSNVLKIVQKTPFISIHAITSCIKGKHRTPLYIVMEMISRCSDTKSHIFASIAEANQALAQTYFSRNREDIVCTAEMYNILFENGAHFYFLEEILGSIKNMTLSYLKKIGTVALEGVFSGKVKVSERRYNDPGNAPFLKYLEVAECGESTECQICLIEFEEGDVRVFSKECDHSIHDVCGGGKTFKCFCGVMFETPRVVAPEVKLVRQILERVDAGLSLEQEVSPQQIEELRALMGGREILEERMLELEQEARDLEQEARDLEQEARDLEQEARDLEQEAREELLAEELSLARAIGREWLETGLPPEQLLEQENAYMHSIERIRARVGEQEAPVHEHEPVERVRSHIRHIIIVEDDEENGTH